MGTVVLIWRFSIKSDISYVDLGTNTISSMVPLDSQPMCIMALASPSSAYFAHLTWDESRRKAKKKKKKTTLCAGLFSLIWILSTLDPGYIYAFFFPPGNGRIKFPLFHLMF